MEIIPITEIKKSRIAEVMIRIFLSGATYQFVNAGFGIIRLKYFLDSNGPNAMGEIASIVAIWGLMTILTEDFRHLLRTKNIESSGLVKDTKLSLGLNIRAKAPIIIISLAAITTTDGSTISSFNVLTISIFLIGYFLTIINCSLIGVLEANNQYVKLNFLQIFFAIANFILFFPIVYYCSSLGFLANLIITSNFIAFPLYFVVRKICQEQYFTFDRPLTLSKISSSKIYLYVLALQTSSYVFDPLIILHLASKSEAVEYSLIRRIGLIMTVSTLSLGPYFSSLGSRQLTKLPKLRMNLLSIALISTFLYLVVSTQVIGLVF
ncbi:MAG: hypothetical protein EB100_09435, partial [Crocinitomicaceae bacterium]|nr:hypothetical protein [Crocinitomicaceae bacterium]